MSGGPPRYSEINIDIGGFIRFLIFLTPVFIICASFYYFMFGLHWLAQNPLVVLLLLVLIGLGIGARIRHTRQFDYHKLVIKWPKGYTKTVDWQQISATTPNGIREYLWENLRPQIEPEINKWLEDGWEIAQFRPAGPHNIKTRRSRRLFDEHTYHEPKEFRIKLRRLKQDEAAALQQSIDDIIGEAIDTITPDDEPPDSSVSSADGTH